MNNPTAAQLSPTSVSLNQADVRSYNGDLLYTFHDGLTIVCELDDVVLDLNSED
jgi:hypothetical protein